MAKLMSPLVANEKSSPLALRSGLSRGVTTPSLAGFAHAERLAVGENHDAVVQQSVEQADGDGLLGEEPPPLVEGPVAGDREGHALVGGGDEPEEELGTGVVEWGEADLVNDDEVGPEQLVDDLPTELSASPR
jgi:hypothetical protein